LLVQPVFHVGLVSFPGATNRFTYTSLLQAADIQLDSAFTADILAEREKALEKFFARAGYFEASVRARPESDETHKLVNVIFDCELNKRAQDWKNSNTGSFPGKKQPNCGERSTL